VVVDEYGYEGNTTVNPWGEPDRGLRSLAALGTLRWPGPTPSHGDYVCAHTVGACVVCGGAAELDGESPARLRFPQVGHDVPFAPFRTWSRRPELVVNGTALAKPGEALFVSRGFGGEKAL